MCDTGKRETTTSRWQGVLRYPSSSPRLGQDFGARTHPVTLTISTIVRWQATGRLPSWFSHESYDIVETPKSQYSWGQTHGGVKGVTLCGPGRCSGRVSGEDGTWASECVGEDGPRLRYHRRPKHGLVFGLCRTTRLINPTTTGLQRSTVSPVLFRT